MEYLFLSRDDVRRLAKGFRGDDEIEVDDGCGGGDGHEEAKYPSPLGHYHLALNVNLFTCHI